MKFLRGVLFTLLIMALTCTTSGCSPASIILPLPTTILYTTDTESTFFGGQYGISNNMWGKTDAGSEPYAQHMDVYQADQQNVIAQWTWTWPVGPGLNKVKAWPNILYGKRPWFENSTVSVLPVQLDDMGNFIASYDTKLTTTRDSVINTAFDLWLTDERTATSATIDTEVMIWLNRRNWNISGIDGRAIIDGQEYDYILGDQPDWHYVAFIKVNQESAGTIFIDSFLRFLVDNGIVPGSNYLSDIEFGNEIRSGSGTMTINSYSVVAIPPAAPTPVGGGARDTTGVFRPSNGALYLKNSNSTGFADVAINYGLPNDDPVVGDWDGNGTATIGIYRNGSFFLRNENTIGFADIMFAFGQPGDQPIAGDWDGDGVDTIGVYRPSIGQFLMRNSNSAGAEDMSFYLGNVGDVGIAGDWNGDGIDSTGVFRPSNGVIFLKNTNSTGFADIALNYGVPGDQPVVGDWNGDGVDTIGVYRNGTFYLHNSNTVGIADMVFALGIPGDMPISGDWDGLSPP